MFLTGASSGLGEAFAQHYAARGAVIGLVARREDKLQSLAQSLLKLGARGVHTYACDVTDVPRLREAATQFMQQAGVPDVVIANAGVSVGTLTEYAEDFDAFAKVMQTNVLGMVATFQPFIAPMRERAHSGQQDNLRLVGIASVAGIRGLPGSGAYSASKAAAISYLESLRVDLRGSGIKVCTICPGYVATPMTAINPYRMPFILPAEEATRRMLRVIDAGKSYAVVPWQMGLVAKLLRVLPNALFDRLFANVKRKPRGLI